MKVPCKLLYVIQVKEFLIKCSTSWPYLISEFLVAYITIVTSDWPRTFFTPKVFLFSIEITLNGVVSLLQKLKPFKACGPDQIPNCILKEVAREIAPALSLLYQSSFRQAFLICICVLYSVRRSTQ